MLDAAAKSAYEYFCERMEVKDHLKWDDLPGHLQKIWMGVAGAVIKVYQDEEDKGFGPMFPTRIQ